MVGLFPMMMIGIINECEMHVVARGIVGLCWVLSLLDVGGSKNKVGGEQSRRRTK